MYRVPPCTPRPHDPLKPTFFCSFLCSLRWNMLPLTEIRPKGRKIQNSKWPLAKTLFLMKSYIFWYNYATKISNTSIPMFPGMLNAMEYSKSDHSEYINNKIQDSCQNKFFAILAIYTRNLTDLLVSATIRHPLIFFVTFAVVEHQGSLSVCYVTICQPEASYS